MSELSAANLRTIFQAIGDAIEADKGRLSELDGVIGDADHGVTMSIGFTAVNEALGKLDGSADPTTVFNAAAKSFLNAVGASSGPLFGTAFMRAGAALKGKAGIDRDGLADCIAAMAKGMQDRGKAERCEKTMMDAWLPAADAAQEAKARGDDAVAVLQSAVAAAQAGAEAAKAMLATKGRASRLGERALGHMDPGAASAVTILKAMTEAVRRLF